MAADSLQGGPTIAPSSKALRATHVLCLFPRTWFCRASALARPALPLPLRPARRMERTAGVNAPRCARPPAASTRGRAGGQSRRPAKLWRWLQLLLHGRPHERAMPRNSLAGASAMLLATVLSAFAGASAGAPTIWRSERYWNTNN